MSKLMSVELETVLIPEGDFLMGSETGSKIEMPVHSVWIDSFAIAKYPVTRWAYAVFLEATQCNLHSTGICLSFRTRINRLLERAGMMLLIIVLG